MKAIVLGGGFAGCTAAHLLKEAGYEVTLFEREAELGGGCRTIYYGGHPYTNGPRVYYGYSPKVFEWVNRFTPLRRFPFELLTYVESDERFYTYPIHERDIPYMRKAESILAELAQVGRAKNDAPPTDFEDYWIRRVGRTLYDMFVNSYSRKMWMIDDNRIFDIFKWSAKDKPIESGTREAYKGSYLGYPVSYSGYNQYFERMVEGVHVITGKHAFLMEGISADGKHPVVAVEDNHEECWVADVVVSTLPVDELLGYRHGELPYVGREFFPFIVPCRQVFPGDVRFCHYAGTEPWTRITEFKKITYYESADSLLLAERPSKVNKLYPYLTKANEALAKRYLDDVPQGVHSIGRLGTYKYSTIEQTIIQAFDCVAKITGTPSAMAGEWRGIGDTALMKDRKEKQ